MSSIDFDILNNIVCLVAKRKSGKSQLLRYIITKNKHKFDKMFLYMYSRNRICIRLYR